MGTFMSRDFSKVEPNAGLAIPAGAKIKARMQKVIQNRELMLEGVAGIVEGLNPKLIRSKLEAYEGEAHATKEAKAPKAGKAPAQAAPAEG